MLSAAFKIRPPKSSHVSHARVPIWTRLRIQLDHHFYLDKQVRRTGCDSRDTTLGYFRYMYSSLEYYSKLNLLHKYMYGGVCSSNVTWMVT